MSETALTLVPAVEKKRTFTPEQKAQKAAYDRARVFTPEQLERRRQRDRARVRVRTPRERERDNASRRARFAAHPELHAKANARGRAHHAAHAEHALALSRVRLYGLTREAFDVLLEVQDHGCAICRTPLLRDRRTHVDHDHETNRVRGLLCLQCNMMLGLVHDSPERLVAAADYLKRKR